MTCHEQRGHHTACRHDWLWMGGFWEMCAEIDMRPEEEKLQETFDLRDNWLLFSLTSCDLFLQTGLFISIVFVMHTKWVHAFYPEWCQLCVHNSFTVSLWILKVYDFSLLAFWLPKEIALCTAATRTKRNVAMPATIVPWCFALQFFCLKHWLTQKSLTNVSGGHLC